MLRPKASNRVSNIASNTTSEQDCKLFDFLMKCLARTRHRRSSGNASLAAGAVFRACGEPSLIEALRIYQGRPVELAFTPHWRARPAAPARSIRNPGVLSPSSSAKLKALTRCSIRAARFTRSTDAIRAHHQRSSSAFPKSPLKQKWMLRLSEFVSAGPAAAFHPANLSTVE